MSESIRLIPENLKKIREINPMMMSYNIEFAEVTGGTFWKSYTPGQIAGTESFYVEPAAEGIAAMYKDLMQVYPPINLYDEKVPENEEPPTYMVHSLKEIESIL